MKHIFKVFFAAATLISGTARASLLVAGATPRLVGGGSTVQNPDLQNKVLTLYNQYYPCPVIRYNLGDPAALSGSGNGKVALAARSIDFGGADTAPSNSELVNTFGESPVSISDSGVLTFPTAGFGTAVIANIPSAPANYSLKLDGMTIAKIYDGAHTTWDQIDPALAATPIIPVYRSEASGTSQVFTTYLTRSTGGFWPATRVGQDPTVFTVPGKFNPDQVGVLTSAGVLQTVQGTPGAIGYVGSNYLLTTPTVATGLLVGSIENQAGSFVQPSVTGISVALEAAQLVDPTSNDCRYDAVWHSTDAVAYPLSNPTNVLVWASQPTAFHACNTRQLLRFMLSEAQSLLGSQGLAPLPEPIATSAKDRLSLITSPKLCSEPVDPCCTARCIKKSKKHRNCGG